MARTLPQRRGGRQAARRQGLIGPEGGAASRVGAVLPAAASAMEGSGLGFVADHLDIVPVRADDESRVVVRVVLRAQAGRAIVLAARCQSRAMEGVDLPAILRRERQVKIGGLLLSLEHAQ